MGENLSSGKSSVEVISSGASSSSISSPVKTGTRSRAAYVFIIGSASAATISIFGVSSDLLVYLTRRYNVESIKAAQFCNIIVCLINLTPVAGAILCDSYLGCFLTINISLFLSLLGTFFLTLTSVVSSLGPSPCDAQKLGSCQRASIGQLAALFFAFAWIALGASGTSYMYVALGADQFDKPVDQEVFVNWYFFFTTLSTLIAYTAVIYILDNVGWGWGYGLCTLLNAIGLVMMFAGKSRYRCVRPKGSPFVSLARVVCAAIRKIKMPYSSNENDYYCGGGSGGGGGGGDDGGGGGGVSSVPKGSQLTSTFRFLNKAALVMQGDLDANGTLARPWRLCTTQEVEDLKTLLKLLPLWSTGVYPIVSLGMQVNLTILQALTMDRAVGPHFKIPPASFQVFAFLSMFVFLPIIDRFFYPVLRALSCKSPSVLHRVGVGHVVNIAGMGAMALVESRRLQVVRQGPFGPGSTLPVSALLLVPPVLIVGAASAFYFPGQVSMYYQEFPVSLKATGTSMMSLTMGIGFCLGAPVLGVVKRVSTLLPDDINQGHVEYVYCLLAGLGGLNFIYYVLCAKLYKLKAYTVGTLKT